MQIISLQLENLRSYREANIEFVPGVNAIVGANGAGKSTILSAIGLALFNTRPPGINGDDLVREGAGRATVVVTLESANDGRCYQVERRLGAGNRQRVYDLELGKTIVAEGATDVASWLRLHLGVGAEMKLEDLFQNTIGVYQGTFTAPFLLPAGQRKGIFDPLLRVDEYRRAVEALLDPLHVLNAQDRTASVQLAVIKGALSALPGLQQQAAALEARIIQNEQSLQTTQAALTQAAALCADYDRRREAAQKAQQARDQLTAEAGRLEGSLTGASEALQRARLAAERVLNAEAGQRRYVTAEKERARLDGERRAREVLVAQIAELDKLLAAASALAQAQRERLAELAAHAARAAELEPAARQQEALEAKLREASTRVLLYAQANQGVADAEQRLATHQAELVRLRAECDQAVRLNEERTQAQAALEEQQRMTEQRQAERGALDAERRQVEKQVQDLAAAEGALCPLCEGPLTEEHRAELLERNVARLVDIAAAQGRLATQQAQADSERRALQARINQLQQRLRALAGEEQLQAAVAKQPALVDDLAVARERLASLGSPAEDEARLQGELAALGKPAQELAVCQAELTKQSQYQQALDRAVAEQGNLQAKRGTIQSALDRYADLEQRDAAVTVALRDSRADHNEYMANAREAGEAPAREAQVNNLKGQLSAQAGLLEAAEVALREAGARYDSARHQEAQVELLRLQGQVGGLQAQLGTDRANQVETRQRLAQLEEQRTQEAQLQAERDRIKRITGLIEWARDLLGKAGPLVTRQLVQRVTLDAASLFSELMDNHGVRLSWAEDYGLSLEVQGQQREFTQLSGGEQMCAALALRLALLRNLSGIDVAFFDEPTAHLDADRRALLAHTLTQVHGFKQIFVISHDSTFEQAAQAYFAVSKDGNGSHIERV